MTVDPYKRPENPISHMDSRYLTGTPPAMESGGNFSRFAGSRRATELKEESGDRMSMDSGELLRVSETRIASRKSDSGELKRNQEERSDDWRFPFVHHQVLKIREEDSHLGEDWGEGLSAKDKIAFLHLRSQVDALLCSRPILRSSPLGNKTAIEPVQ